MSFRTVRAFSNLKALLNNSQYFSDKPKDARPAANPVLRCAVSLILRRTTAALESPFTPTTTISAAPGEDVHQLGQPGALLRLGRLRDAGRHAGRVLPHRDLLRVLLQEAGDQRGFSTWGVRDGHFPHGHVTSG